MKFIENNQRSQMLIHDWNEIHVQKQQRNIR